MLHFGVAFLVVLGVGVLVLAYRDRLAIDLSNQLATLLSMCIGVAFGMVWELVEFIIDWVRASAIQTSNTQTMLDLLWTDVGAVLGAIVATSVYCRWLPGRQRQEIGDFSVWVSDGPLKVIQRQGLAMTLAWTAIVVVAVAALWFTGRPVPGFSNG
jgi:hypothetical protein